MSENTVMNIREIRHLNALYLRRSSKPKTVTGMAARLGKGVSQTSAFAGDKPSKPIGDRIAREIEVAYGKRSGWLDILYSTRKPESAEDRADQFRENYLQLNHDSQLAFDQLIDAFLNAHQN